MLRQGACAATVAGGGSRPAPHSYPARQAAGVTSQRRRTSMEILDKIRERKARTGVIGLGYVGLPLAIEFAHAGFHAVGIDVDTRRVDAINAGQSYIVDTSSEEVASLVATGRLHATTDFAAIADLDTINI